MKRLKVSWIDTLMVVWDSVVRRDPADVRMPHARRPATKATQWWVRLIVAAGVLSASTNAVPLLWSGNLIRALVVGPVFLVVHLLMLVTALWIAVNVVLAVEKKDESKDKEEA